jgi:hypothetical protein
MLWRRRMMTLYSFWQPNYMKLKNYPCLEGRTCGVKKWDFPAILAKFEVPYFQYTGDDFLNEFKS